MTKSVVFRLFTRSSLLTLYILFRFSFKDDHKAAKRRAYIRVRRTDAKANEEIAEQLFLNSKTDKTHLRSIFAKRLCRSNK